MSSVRAAPGVVAVLTAADVPGVNDVGPVVAGDPVLADGMVEYAGQVVFAVAATLRADARRAARLAWIAYEERAAILTLEDSRAACVSVAPWRVMTRGDGAAAIDAAPHPLWRVPRVRP